MKITELTPEMEMKLQEIKDFWLEAAIDIEKKIDQAKATQGIYWLYDTLSLPNPEILFLPSPAACWIKADKQSKLYHIGNTLRWSLLEREIYSSGFYTVLMEQIEVRTTKNIRHEVKIAMESARWNQIQTVDRWETRYVVSDHHSFSRETHLQLMAYLDFFGYCTETDISMLAGLDVFRDLLLSGMYSMVMLNDLCLVSAMPVDVSYDARQRLHHTGKAALLFRDGYGQHFIHGRFVEPMLVRDIQSGSYTLEEWMEESDEEIRAAVYEIMGQERFIVFIGATLEDETTITHPNLETETLQLWATDSEIPELRNPLKWVAFLCPSTGTKYFIDCDPSYYKAIDAAKSLRPFTGNHLNYIWHARS
jgi:hypothetical protein